MLTPRTAKLILNLSLYGAFLAVGLTALLALSGLLLAQLSPSQGTQTAHMSIGVGTKAILKNAAGFEILIRQVWVPIEIRRAVTVITATAIASLILCLLLFVGLVRLRAFVNRVIDDPFHPQNAADFRLASRVALAVQGLLLLRSAISAYASRLFHTDQLLREALRGSGFTANIHVDPFSTAGGIFGWLFPLLAAVILAVLATVFRRGHELRQEEQRLREEQVLTI